jgi:DNA-directed RNA polymerase subunit RPC12/RpoP
MFSLSRYREHSSEKIGGVRMIKMDLKGVVACPVCGKKFLFAYSDAKGHASVPCIRCSRILMVDYERPEAKLITPKRRAKI